jgi:hypothetical protein
MQQRLDTGLKHAQEARVKVIEDVESAAGGPVNAPPEAILSPSLPFVEDIPALALAPEDVVNRKRAAPVSYKTDDMCKRRRKARSGHELLRDGLQKKLNAVNSKLIGTVDNEECKDLMWCARQLSDHLLEVDRGLQNHIQFMQTKMQ